MLAPRRLSYEELTPDQKAAVDAHRAQRRTHEYQAELARDIAAIRREYPPLRADPALAALLDRMRIERERQGISLADLQARTRLAAGFIENLERGEIPDPRLDTLQTYAKALGKRFSWSLVDLDAEALETALTPQAPEISAPTP